MEESAESLPHAHQGTVRLSRCHQIVVAESLAFDPPDDGLHLLDGVERADVVTAADGYNGDSTFGANSRRQATSSLCVMCPASSACVRS